MAKKTIEQRVLESTAIAERLTLSLGQQLVASLPYRADAANMPATQVGTAAQFADVLLDSTNDDRGVFNPTTPPRVGEAASSGGRVVGRCSVVPVTDEVIARARETARTSAAAKTAWGTAAPEFEIAFDRGTPEFVRIPVYVNVDDSVWSSPGAAQSVVDAVLRQDVARAIDDFVLNEATTGALQDSSVTSLAKGGATRFDAIVDAATRVRGRGYDGVVTAVVAPTDHKALVTEATSGVRAYDSAILRDLGIEVVNSSSAASGTALVGALVEAVTVWVKAPNVGVANATEAQLAQITASDSHASNFLNGRVTILATAQVQSHVQRPSGLVKVTSF